MASMLGSESRPAAQFVPEELVDGLRLSKPVPLEAVAAQRKGSLVRVDVRVVHGDEYAPVGFLVRMDYGVESYGGSRYCVFTKTLEEAARLTALSEEELKAQVRDPEPVGHF